MSSNPGDGGQGLLRQPHEASETRTLRTGGLLRNRFWWKLVWLGTTRQGFGASQNDTPAIYPGQRKKDHSQETVTSPGKPLVSHRSPPKSMKTVPKNPCLQNSRFSVEAGSGGRGTLSSRDLPFGLRSERAPFTTNDLSSCHHGDITRKSSS